ncbi:MAG TPA: YkgJ family cysteine cluster protein [Syntrophomonadaceae bacterium]|nr:YkgJ family cysteine cluster protein [Syntrophomonadaceae bacterium]
MKIELYQASEGGKLGIGIKVLDRSANLADLLNAWQPLCDDVELIRPYGNGEYTSCKGCQINCCNTAYVIPDLIAFKKMSNHLDLSYEDFIAGYFQEEKVKNGLLRMEPEPCIFLRDNICTIYSIRSLICRFYLCSPLLPATEQLIYSITWTGTAAMQLFAEELGLISHMSKHVLSSFDQLFVSLFEEYRFNPNVLLFSEAEDYKDVPLEPFLD